MLHSLVPIPDHGFPDSFHHAYESYHEALEANPDDGAAMAGIATMLLFGWGVGRDYDIAGALFGKAARLVHGRGQAGVGILCANGWGCDLDYTKAFVMLHLAAAQVHLIVAGSRVCR